MTASATDGGAGPFDTTFNLAAAVIAALVFLFGLVAAWTGYQESQLPLVGTEMSVVKGTVLLTFAVAVAVVALWIALYMESGFGETTGHAGDADEPGEPDAASPETDSAES